MTGLEFRISFTCEVKSHHFGGFNFYYEDSLRRMVVQLVKVAELFYKECKLRGTDKELLVNKKGRPCVLVVKLRYKGKNRKFVVPLRSNIAQNTPKEQYFALPPNSSTKDGNRHGVHYIKMFPIDDKYIQKYISEYENGKKNRMTPEFDDILSWL